MLTAFSVRRPSFFGFWCDCIFFDAFSGEKREKAQIECTANFPLDFYIILCDNIIVKVLYKERH